MIFGMDRRFLLIFGTYSVQDFDLALAAIGWTTRPNTFDSSRFTIEYGKFVIVPLDKTCKLGLDFADVMRCTAVNHLHPRVFSVLRDSTFQ